jgi:hypothetical protein
MFWAGLPCFSKMLVPQATMVSPLLRATNKFIRATKTYDPSGPKVYLFTKLNVRFSNFTIFVTCHR